MAATSPDVRRGVHYRALTTFITTIAFLLMALSGVMLYLAPRGRVANWTDWSLLGLSKEQWSGLHMTAGLLLLLAVVVHLCFNLKPLWHYLRGAAPRRRPRIVELAVASVVVGLLVAGTLGGLPPFSAVTHANERIKDWWESGAAPAGQAVAARAQAPAGTVVHKDRGQTQHFGQMTLAEFCRTEGHALPEALRRLQAAGVDATERSRLRDLATRLDMAPRDLAQWLRHGA
jgi:hypothetical protein